MDLTQAASRFYSLLQDLYINKTPDENQRDWPTAITTFFFVNTFGEVCQKKMFTLLDTMIFKVETKTSASTNKNQKVEMLPALKDFVNGYKIWEYKDVKQKSNILSIANTLRNYKICKKYYDL